MGDKSGIHWTDATWNPTVGCSKVSPGCEHCYAIVQAFRLEHHFNQIPYMGTTYERPDGSKNWSGQVFLLHDRLQIPLRWKRPRRIFVDSMSDLFHPSVPAEFIARVFAVMDGAKQHSFQVLTKRPERAAEILTHPSFAGYVDEAQAELAAENGWCYVGTEDWPIPNVWMGTSVEDQERADQRVPILLQIPAAVRFLSCEPLLGPLDLTDYLGWECARCDGEKYNDVDGRWSWPASEPRPSHHCYTESLAPNWAYARLRIGWVITGGESGKDHRPFDPAWARSLRDQCEGVVPFFYKQGGGMRPGLDRELDGRLWEEFPDQPARQPARRSVAARR